MNVDCNVCIRQGACSNVTTCSDTRCGSFVQNYGHTCDRLETINRFDCSLCRAEGGCPVHGCMNTLATNYNPAANIDNVTDCQYSCPGAMGSLTLSDAFGDGWTTASESLIVSIGCDHSGYYRYGSDFTTGSFKQYQVCIFCFQDTPFFCKVFCISFLVRSRSRLWIRDLYLTSGL